MSKTLTIVIKDIPDDHWQDMWKQAKKDARSEFGLQLPETETISVKAEDFINQDAEMYADLLACALSGHVIDTTQKIFNQ